MTGTPQQHFLRENQKIAYSLPEIVRALGYKIGIRDLGRFVGGVAGFWLFQNAIEDLIKEGLLKQGKSEKTLKNKDCTRPHSDNKVCFLEHSGLSWLEIFQCEVWFGDQELILKPNSLLQFSFSLSSES